MHVLFLDLWMNEYSEEILKVLSQSIGSWATPLHQGCNRDIFVRAVAKAEEAPKGQLECWATAIGRMHKQASVGIPVGARTGQGHASVCSHHNPIVGIGIGIHPIEANIAIGK